MRKLNIDLATAIAALSNLARIVRGQLRVQEAEMNPLIIRTDGVIAVDGLIVLHDRKRSLREAPKSPQAFFQLVLQKRFLPDALWAKYYASVAGESIEAELPSRGTNGPSEQRQRLPLYTPGSRSQITKGLLLR